MTTLPLPRLASHGLAALTADDVRAALRVVAREDLPTVWAQVCQAAGLSQGVYLLHVHEQEALTAAVAALPGALGVVGRGLSVRVAAYRALQESGSGTTAYDWSRRCMEGLIRSRMPDRARLVEIDELDLFGEKARTLCDKAARRVSDRLRAPVVGVSVVLEGAQVFVGQVGLQGWLGQVRGTPVEWSLCATTLRTRQPYFVPDAGHDVVQRTNPLVRHDGLQSYAGVPLLTSEGHVLGAACVLGDTPRTFDEREVAQLEDIARSLVADLEARRRTSAAAPAPRVLVPA